MTQELQQHDTT